MTSSSRLFIPGLREQSPYYLFQPLDLHFFLSPLCCSKRKKEKKNPSYHLKIPKSKIRHCFQWLCNSTTTLTVWTSCRHKHIWWRDMCGQITSDCICSCFLNLVLLISCTFFCTLLFWPIVPYYQQVDDDASFVGLCCISWWKKKGFATVKI